MKQVTLPPIRETREDFEEIEKHILGVLRKEIYLPILREAALPKATLQNAIYDLMAAIRSGKTRYYAGEFRGSFNSRISKELREIGAKWDRTQGSWKIPRSKLTSDILRAIEVSEEKFRMVSRRIDEQLAAVVPEKIAEKLKVDKYFDSTLYRVESRFQKQVRAITVAPELSKEARALFAQNYTENLKRDIEDFTRKEILRLRKRVQSHAMEGNRYEDLVKGIKRSYGVTESKAKFLARQETSTMMATFKEARYRAVGSEQYIWTCVSGTHEHPVRPMHAKLNGKVCRWDTPPVVDEDGNRKHPGVDFGCRCAARPIMQRASKAAIKETQEMIKDREIISTSDRK